MSETIRIPVEYFGGDRIVKRLKQKGTIGECGDYIFDISSCKKVLLTLKCKSKTSPLGASWVMKDWVVAKVEEDDMVADYDWEYYYIYKNGEWIKLFYDAACGEWINYENRERKPLYARAHPSKSDLGSVVSKELSFKRKDNRRDHVFPNEIFVVQEGKSEIEGDYKLIGEVTASSYKELYRYDGKWWKYISGREGDIILLMSTKMLCAKDLYVFTDHIWKKMGYSFLRNSYVKDDYVVTDVMISNSNANRSRYSYGSNTLAVQAHPNKSDLGSVVSKESEFIRLMKTDMNNIFWKGYLSTPRLYDESYLEDNDEWYLPHNYIDDKYKEDELNFTHPDPPIKMPTLVNYDGDLFVLQKMDTRITTELTSVDDLLARDKQREKDGFRRRIKMGKIVKPSRKGKVRFVMVPTTVEEKFYHDRTPKPPKEDPQGTGSAEGEEGEVIGESPIKPKEGEGGEGSAGQGSGGEHEVESNAYELGKSLTEEFELPNIKDKAKKKAIDKYVYDLTDKHRGFGQILDKKATLRKIVETNIALGRGNLPDIANVDTNDFIVSPDDKIYRVLSREKMYESQALVFFLRDYSASMYGEPTNIVVGQHIMIYSWLLYQYQKNVETRFILHDTEAKEVPDFFTYYNSIVAGGTYVYSAFELVNKLIYEENLARDYNLYIFYGTDGDDWNEKGEKTLDNIRQMLEPTPVVSRIGITIVNRGTNKSPVEKYISNSGMMVKYSDYLKLSLLTTAATEKDIINSIKQIIG